MLRKNTKGFLFSLLMLVSLSSVGQNIRGFYLSGIGTWLGNTTKENAILSYAQGNGYNYINFYDLGSINWSSTTEKNQLASFMSRGRTQYGILQFGAIVEVYSYFLNNILPYNKSRNSSNEKFDVINLEFEFWVRSSISSSYCSKFLSPNGYSCDTAGAFKFAWKQFKLIDSACAALGLISEVYLGWPNKGQIQKLASIADRILLHAYRPTDSDVYSYSKDRLINIAGVGAGKKVIPLFSGEPDFMGPWLNTHPISRPYQTYARDLAAETASFKNNISLQGYHWFKYDEMPKTFLATATITANGPISFCSGGNVTLTANTSSAYLWTPGGLTTRSIYVTDPGSYTVRVTNASGVNITSAPVTVRLLTEGTVPTITASGPLSFCPTSSVTLTSSSADTYRWSNGETTRSITVSTSGNYSLVVGTGGCTATSAIINVNATAPPVTPTTTPNGSVSFCAGGNVTITSSAASSYSWSNGATTRSITVSTPGTYKVTTGSGACSATSSTVNATLTASPSTPTVTASGTTSFCPGGSVTLTSSQSTAYLWSNGSTNQTITVTASGNYSVRVGSGSCTATSSTVNVNANSSPPAPTVTASGSLSICQGNQVILTSSTSSGYRWSTGETTQSISVSTAGTYNVRTYAGPNCFSQSADKSITVKSAPATPVITPNGSTELSSSQPTVSLSSTQANSYSWSNNQTTNPIIINAQGSYFVTITGTNGCTASSNPIVITSLICTPPAIPEISLSGPDILAPGQTVNLTSSSGNGYLWSTGETSRSITVSTAGIYTVKVFNGSDCFSTSLPVNITMEVSTGIETLNSKNDNIIFSLYPNPATEEFNVLFTIDKRRKISLSLIDVTGRILMQRIISALPGENQIKINASELSRGIYFASMLYDNEKQMIKVVIE